MTDCFPCLSCFTGTFLHDAPFVPFLNCFRRSMGKGVLFFPPNYFSPSPFLFYSEPWLFLGCLGVWSGRGVSTLSYLFFCLRGVRKFKPGFQTSPRSTTSNHPPPPCTPLIVNLVFMVFLKLPHHAFLVSPLQGSMTLSKPLIFLNLPQMSLPNFLLLPASHLALPPKSP